MPENNDLQLVEIFNSHVRTEVRDGKVWVSVIDVIEVLTGTDRPKKYWSDLKQKLIIENSQVSEKIGRFKLVASDGKKRLTDCAEIETLLRIIQSIPSPKAEPFKQWLAKTGYERLKEENDPELAIERTRQTYLNRGYNAAWIDLRFKSIEQRHQLTKEWQDRGIKNGREFGMLTNEVAKGAFGLVATEHKKIKGLKNQNLRDHMTPTELLLQMLAEQATKDITQERDAHGFNQNLECAKEGGEVAGDARKSLEKKLGQKVISPKNNLRVKQIN